ncbi:DUF1450 domain-containing protein [Rubeoparvulum massiliense]|uniref:DUF1450 domain-containing protein n=1 Tax=Rubeoparvulum massiliense TaxID=1631346 RepID=UPI00065E1595|nr:DUF1450 domain-containing protein [Rubeoparvulum massiliense]
MIFIQCCETNLSYGTVDVIRQLQEQEEIEVLTESCLDECEACARQLFLYVEGERITGETVPILLQRTLEEIGRQRKMEELLQELSHDV